MKEEVNAPGCGREDDLIAFLYDELNDVESRTFQRHLHDCSACSAELVAFRKIRESVVAWRNEALGGVESRNAVHDAAIASVRQRKPSALAALREFFNLSPIWMKGAVAFASLLFCLFTVLAIARWLETPQPTVASTSGGKLYTEQQVNALVSQRVQEEIQRIKGSQEQTPDSSVIADNGRPVNSGKATASRGSELARNSNGAKARRPLTKSEREQLATDLRIISSKNDSEIDLLGDRINQ